MDLFIFTPILGEAEPILTSIFFKWVVQPPTREDWPWNTGWYTFRFMGAHGPTENKWRTVFPELGWGG